VSLSHTHADAMWAHSTWKAPRSPSRCLRYCAACWPTTKRPSGYPSSMPTSTMTACPSLQGHGRHARPPVPQFLKEQAHLLRPQEPFSGMQTNKKKNKNKKKKTNKTKQNKQNKTKKNKFPTDERHTLTFLFSSHFIFNLFSIYFYFLYLIFYFFFYIIFLSFLFWLHFPSTEPEQAHVFAGDRSLAQPDRR